MITPDSEASNKVTTRMGHEPASEPRSGLSFLLSSFTKKATPGDSTNKTRVSMINSANTEQVMVFFKEGQKMLRSFDVKKTKKPEVHGFQ